MVKLLKLPIVSACALLISCTPKAIPTAETRIININDAHFIDIPLDKLLTASEFLPLEFTTASALSESAMFLNWTAGFYLMDAYRAKTVYQFDKKGKFIRTIGKTGKGPGEYILLTDALITKTGLEILTGNTKTEVLKYDTDGKLIKTDQILDKPSNSFAVNPKNGDYYFYNTNYQNLIQIVNSKSLQPTDSFVVRNTSLTPGVSALSTTSLGTVLFYQPFDDRIFELSGNTINLKYRFDVGISTPKYDELTTESAMKMITERELWFVYKALENANWLYLLVSQQVAGDESQSQFYSLLYEKKTEKIFQLPDSPEIGPLFRPAFGLDENDILYTAVQPVNVYQSEAWKSEFQKKGLPLSPEGNYTVVKIPLNKLVKN